MIPCRDTLAPLTFFDENYNRNTDICVYNALPLSNVRFVIPKQLPSEEVSQRRGKASELNNSKLFLRSLLERYKMDEKE